jgi:hypothetical protein
VAGTLGNHGDAELFFPGEVGSAADEQEDRRAASDPRLNDRVNFARTFVALNRDLNGPNSVTPHEHEH